MKKSNTSLISIFILKAICITLPQKCCAAAELSTINSPQQCPRDREISKTLNTFKITRDILSIIRDFERLRWQTTENPTERVSSNKSYTQLAFHNPTTLVYFDLKNASSKRSCTTVDNGNLETGTIQPIIPPNNKFISFPTKIIAQGGIVAFITATNSVGLIAPHNKGIWPITIIRRLPEEIPAAVHYSLALSPNGQTCAIGRPLSIDIIDLPSKQTTKIPSTKLPSALAFIPRNNNIHLAVGYPGNTKLNIINPKIGDNVVEQVDIKNDNIQSLTANSSHLIVHAPYEITILETKTLKPIQRIPYLTYEGESVSFTDLALSAESEHLALATAYGIYLYKNDNDTFKQVLTFPNQLYRRNHFSFSPDSQSLAYLTADGCFITHISAALKAIAEDQKQVCIIPIQQPLRATHRPRHFPSITGFLSNLFTKKT